MTAQPTEREKRLARGQFRKDDPLGSAVLQSVEFDHPVHRAYREDEAKRLKKAAASVEHKPQRWHQERDANRVLTGKRIRLSLGSLVYRGQWFDGKPWRVQLDDAPPDVVTEEVEVG